ncbi:MAG: hypothetical protein V2A76_15515 [Planctomycetota bacterium]
MAEVPDSPGNPGPLGSLAWVAAIVALGYLAGCWILGSPGAALAGLIGALGGILTQGVAVFLLVRSVDRNVVGFLGAFALASLLRVLGGVLLVLLPFVCGMPERAAFVAGFAAEYVVLEVTSDVLLVRSLRRMDRAENE